jgi:hypothetical protein
LIQKPEKALAVMQPWAWLLVNGYKDVENRTWRRNSRGPVLIHASKKIDAEANAALLDGLHPVTGEPCDAALDYILAAKAGKIELGGIVGVVEIVDCVSESDSPWFVGPFGFVVERARPLPFHPGKGALSFFPVAYPEELWS